MPAPEVAPVDAHQELEDQHGGPAGRARGGSALLGDALSRAAIQPAQQGSCTTNNSVASRINSGTSVAKVALSVRRSKKGPQHAADETGNGQSGEFP